jgi:replicative DNA helicase
MRIEQIILTSLLYDEDYTRKVIPFLDENYFHQESEKKIFVKIKEHLDVYNTLPTQEILLAETEKDSSINESLYNEITGYVNSQLKYEKKDLQWLLDNTEEFCQEKAVYNAVMRSISIIDGNDKDNTKGNIPNILQDALGISFDDHIGHDYFENAEDRYEFYTSEEEKIPFDIELLNKITKGGLPNKTLNVILAGTGVGKTLAMCHFATANLKAGKKVLYITLEMAEERIAERIDANYLDVDINQLEHLGREEYLQNIDEKLKSNLEGRLVIKEYPTASVGSAHFRHLLNELKLKKDFVPDIVYIDYLNICMSSRLKFGANVNSYTYVKAIAEELRGLAVEKNIPIVSATQLTRTGFTNSDPGLEDTSESFALPATVDFMLALISSEDTEQIEQIMIKQLKNRYNDPTKDKRFTVGLERRKMRLYNVEQRAQENVVDDSTSSNVGGKDNDEKRDFSKLFT